MILAGCSSRKKHSGPLTPQQTHGQRLFHITCAQCHYPDSEKPLAGPGLAGVFDKKFLPSGAPASDERVHETILHGRRNMPGYSQVFTESQIDDIIAYLHTL